jgi:hypothetical protein
MNKRNKGEKGTKRLWGYGRKKRTKIKRNRSSLTLGSSRGILIGKLKTTLIL